MTKLATVALIISLTLQGCATTYSGPNPDLSLKDERAHEEIKKFTIEEKSTWTQPYWYNLGESRESYWIPSVQPVVASVSPEGNTLIEQGYKARRIAWIFLGLTLAALLYDGSLPDGSSDRRFAEGMALGFYLAGFGFIVSGYSDFADASKVYNKDLQKKLSPKVGFNFKF